MAASGAGASWGQIAVWKEEKVREMGPGDAVQPWEAFQATELCPYSYGVNIYAIYILFFLQLNRIRSFKKEKAKLYVGMACL